MTRRGTGARPALTALALLVILFATGCGGEARRPSVLVAVTTSTYDSGLVDVLLPAFEADTGWQARPLVAGSGQALALAARGEADVALAHSPAAERRLVASGRGTSRRFVMSNDFLLVGPREDPAGIRGATLGGALRRIAAAGAPFASRGDDSGTHVHELAAWRRAGVAPGGRWYLETGQGQSATLRVAADRGAYAITDSATYRVTGTSDDLPVVVSGDAGQRNPYHVIPVSDTAGPRVNAAGGAAFADWLVSDRAQELIAHHGRRQHGAPLFAPAASAGAPRDELPYPAGGN